MVMEMERRASTVKVPGGACVCVCHLRVPVDHGGEGRGGEGREGKGRKGEGRGGKHWGHHTITHARIHTYRTYAQTHTHIHAAILTHDKRDSEHVVPILRGRVHVTNARCWWGDE